MTHWSCLQESFDRVRSKISKTKNEDIKPGRKFNDLTIVREVEKARKRRFECRCVCGTTSIAFLAHLKSGHTKSCGCRKFRSEEHKHAKREKRHKRNSKNRRDAWRRNVTEQYKLFASRVKNKGYTWETKLRFIKTLRSRKPKYVVIATCTKCDREIITQCGGLRFNCNCVLTAQRRLEHRHRKQELLRRGIKIHNRWKANTDRVNAECLSCGHVWNVCVNNLRIKNSRSVKYCPKCASKVGVKARRKTCLKRYGVESATQHPDIFKKIMYAQHRFKTLYYKGEIYDELQGYEPQALIWLIERKFQLKAPKNFRYWCSIGKYRRVYIPDLAICSKSGRRYVIEVKSTYTSGLVLSKGNKLFVNMRDKAKGVVESGSNFVLAILHKDKIVFSHGVPNWKDLRSLVNKDQIDDRWRTNPYFGWEKGCVFTSENQDVYG